MHSCSQDDPASRRGRLLLGQPTVVWVTLGLLSGQMLGGWSVHWAAPLLGVIASTICTLRRGSQRLPLTLSMLAVAVGHWQMVQVLHPHFPQGHVALHAGSTVQIRGTIIERPRRGAGRTRIVVAVEAVRGKRGWENSSGRIQVTMRECAQSWRREDRVEARLRLQRPRNFGNPGEFDYEAYLARRKIYVTAFAQSDSSWQRRPAPWAPDKWLERWREHVASIFERTLQSPEKEILAALIIGESDLAPEIRKRYSRTGLSHLLAISGLHVGLVAGAALAVIRRLLCRSEWLLLRVTVAKITVAVAAVPVVLYCALAGGSVPTLRALIMGLFVAGAVLVDRQRHWLANVSAAALVINLLWPGSLFEISFQLSFAAVLAIVLGMQRLAESWAAWEETRLVRLRSQFWLWARRAVMYAGVSLCATAGTLPLTALHFNLVSLVGPAANLLLVPMLGPAPVAVGLLAAFATPFSTRIAAALVALAGTIVRVGDGLVAVAAELPGAAVRVVTPSALEVVVLYLVLAAPMLVPRSRNLVLGVCALVFCVDGIYWYVSRFHRSSLRITFLSVGHGDCTIIEFPGSEVLVLDGGGLSPAFDVGERVVAPYLWRRKIGRVDTLALTHPDFDHYGGLGFLAREFSPGELWWNGARGDGPRFAAFWRSVQQQRIHTVPVGQGFHRRIGGVEVLALGPGGGAANDNDRSLVLRLRYGPAVVLLPGDIEQPGEHRLLATLRPLLHANVLKVPHHGSAHSSSALFLNAVAPRFAIVSAGPNAHLDLPRASVLQAYRQRGVSVLRTDRNGAVILAIGADGTIAVTVGRQHSPISDPPL